MNDKLRGWVIGVGLAMLAAQVAAADQGSAGPTTYQVKIAPQALGAALQEFARQSGVQIIFFSRLTDGLASAGLDGNYTLTDAMSRLLAESGLSFRQLSATTVEVRPVSRAKRRAAPVATDPLPEVVVRATVEQLSVTRVETPIHEIPQTVSVFTKEDMRVVNATDLQDVLEHVPGITVVQSSTLIQQFFSRGFEINAFHVDGGAAVDPNIVSPDLTVTPGPYMPSPDLSEYDHVEILRGSDALFGGYGNPGGTVSLVRKRPREEFAFDTTVLGGSWDQKRVELDVTGPLARDGAFRGRAVAMYSNQHYFYEMAKRERSKMFGVLEYDFSPGATLTAGGSYETDDSRPFLNGMPSYFDGETWERAHFPRSASLNYEWNRFKTDTTQAYVQYRQRFENGWALRLNTAGWVAHVDAQVGDLGGLAIYTPTGTLFDAGTATFTTRPNRYTQISFDATVTGTFGLFGWRADTALGGDFARLKLGEDNESFSGLGPETNPFEYDPRQFPNPREEGMVPFLTHDGYTALDKYGGYASLRIHFGEAWTGTAGARVSHNRYTSSTHVGGEITEPFDHFESVQQSDIVTPFVGLMFESSEHLSWYASYAQMYLNKHVPLFALTELPPIGPVRGVNTEVGVKGTWRDGALNGSMVVYDVKQSNILIDDLEVLLAYVRSSRKSHGVDLELQGELTPGWSIGAGYTWNVNENEEGMPLSRSTPRNLLKLWTNKRLHGAFESWTVGGSLHAQSAIDDSDEILCPRQYRGELCEVNEIEEPAYAVLDLRGSFDFDANWTLALSVNNVFDKVYNQTWANFLHSWYGEPRNFMLRLDGRF
ncbi:MAG TPA: TonB-dependent siderophore receptor [Vicinamibacterales bacterium]|nr:TonB-dependent siderophore receptor [Vicinamibacterales bacterium]